MAIIRWGVVGAGRIAHTFSKDIQWVQEAELSAIAARDVVRARSFADEYQVAKAYGSYDELFNDPDIDAIYIATPHTHHLAQAQAAMKAGKAVLCEKPITVSAHECEQLLSTHTETGSYLMEAMWTHFLPAIRKAQEWISTGKLGQIRHIKVDFGYPQLPFDPSRREYDAELAGGCMLEMGVYPVSLAWLFTQSLPFSVAATGHRAPNGVEDDLTAICDHGETKVTLGTSFRSKLQNWAYIIGEGDRYIAIPDFWRADKCFLYDLDRCIETFEDPRQGSGFEFQIQSVSQDILAGRVQSEIVTLESSLKVQQYMEMIKSRV